MTPSVKRARPAAELLSLAATHGLNARAFGTVRQGYDVALADSAPSDTIFIGGSNYVISDLGAFAEG